MNRKILLISLWLLLGGQSIAQTAPGLWIASNVTANAQLADVGGPITTDTVLLFLHGYNENSDGWGNFVNYYSNNISGAILTQRFRIFYFDYDSNKVAPDGLGAMLSDCMRQADIASNGFLHGKKIVIVAHSMGGLVARQFMMQTSTDNTTLWGERVAKLITLATPFHGTYLANSIAPGGSLFLRIGLTGLLNSDDVDLATVNSAWFLDQSPNQINRKNLWWDGYNEPGWAIGDTNQLLQNLNTAASVYDGKIIAYAGILNSTRFFWDINGFQALAYNAGNNIYVRDLNMSSDGIVPFASAIFQGHLTDQQLRIFGDADGVSAEDYTHTEMWQGKGDGATGSQPVFNSLITDLSAILTAPVSLAISGPTSVNENSSSTTPFTVQVTYIGGLVKTVTPASWSKNSSLVAISTATGVLTAGSVSSDTIVTISASYTESGVTVSSPPINVTVKNVAPAASGAIQVTLSPQGAITAGAMWSIDGQTWESSGSSVTGLSGSSYPVYFKSLPGWITPATQTVSVSSGGTTPVTGQYTQATQTGNLTVLLYPNAAINAGAQWQVDGGTWYNLNSIVTLSAGSHVVNFKTISGWTVPAPVSVTIVANTPNYVSIPQATYTQASTSGGSTGSVTVTLSPSPGSRWTIYPGGTWQTSGTTLNNVPPGTYTVTFEIPPGYLPPTGTTTINVVAGQATQQTFTFPTQADWGNVIVNIFPSGAAQAGAQWTITGYSAQNGGAFLQDVPAGAYHLTFSSVPGYVTPAGGWIYPAGHGTSIITGNYVPIPPGGAVQVLLRPDNAVSAGAKWQVDGGAWNDSGTTIAGLSTSTTHTIQYLSVDGWIAPATQTISASSGLTTTLDTYYSDDTTAPQIFTVTPSDGGLTGGTVVDITGANFGGNVNVDFGGVPATSVNVISSTEITAVAPPQSTGVTVPLEVSTGNGADIQTSGFTYGPNRGKNIQLDKTLGGSVYAVGVLGTHAYISQGASLVDLDISNPANPVPVGQLSLPYFIHHLAIYQGGDGHNYVVIAASVFVSGADAGALLVVDVSDPANPLLKCTLTTGGAAQDVKVLDGLAYVCDGGNGLEIFDLSDPTNPQLKGSLGTLGYCSQVLLDSSGGNGLIAYIAETGDSIEFVDVNDPTNPVYKGTYALNEGDVFSVSMAKAGNVLYVGPENGVGFDYLDVTNLSAPVKIGETGPVPSVMFVQGNQLYAISGGMSIYNVSNPASPSRLTTAPLPGGPFTFVNCAMSGSNLLIAGEESGLSIINIANSSSPSLVGTYQQACDYSLDVYASASQSVLYSGNSNSGINIFSIASPTTAGWLAKVGITNGVSGFGQQGNLLFAASPNGMYVVDVTNPGQPVIKGNFNQANLFGGIGIDTLGQPVIAGSKSDNSGSLWTVDVSNPSSPTTYGSTTTTPAGPLRDLVVNGNYAYVVQRQNASIGGGLRVFDLGNPSSPQQIGSLDIPPWAYGVAISADGQTVYVANAYLDSTHTGGVLIVDVSNPNSPAIVSSFLTDASSVNVNGNRLLVCSSGVHVFDISNPRQPIEIGNYSTPYQYHDKAVMAGNQIYVADGDGGVDILTLNDYTPPSVSITSPTASATYTTNNSAVTLGGSASDDTGVVNVVWSNNLGGSGNATGMTSWTASNIPLQPGDNVITVSAFDAAGNAGTGNITVHENGVAPTGQTITFPTIPDQTLGGSGYTLNATISSGLPVSYQVVAGPATLTGNMLTFSGTGAVTALATQYGGSGYLAAQSVEQIFNVLPATQQITFQPIGTLISGNQIALNATASSGLPVAFTVLAGPGQINQGALTATGLGTIVVRASQSGNGNFQAASPTVQSVIVQSAPVILLAPTPVSGTVGGQAIISVAAVGSPAPTYQWYKNGVPIANANSTVLIFDTLSIADGNSYSVQISNTYNTINSTAITLTVAPPDYTTWSNGLGLSGATAQPTARPFTDTLPNLVSYAMNLGGSPTPSELPTQSTQNVAGTSYLTLQYRQRKGMTGIQMTPQYSTDLINWVSIPSTNISQMPDDDANTARWAASMAIPHSGSIFLRVLIVESQ